MTLIKALQQVKDFRAKRGQRYPLWVILLLVVMGTLNGCSSYQSLDLATTARQFAQGIRAHWGIENRLHWVKDMVFQEDDCPLKLAHAPQNWGLIRTWAINLFRLQGETSITQAQRRVAHDLDALFLLIQ